MLSTTIGALLTIATLSYLFKNTILYRFANKVITGASAAIILTGAMTMIRSRAISLVEGQTYLIIGFLFGLVIFSKFIPRYQWLSRYPLALITATGIGTMLGGQIQANVIAQITATAGLQFFGVDALTIFNNLLIIVFAICALVYFTFTYKIKGALTTIPTVGRYAMMIAFGGSFGYIVQGRFTVLAGRWTYLIVDWLKPLLGF